MTTPTPELVTAEQAAAWVSECPSHGVHINNKVLNAIARTIIALHEALAAEKARAEAAEARVAVLEGALANAVGALDAAGEELSEFSNVLSREPHEANLTYQSARDAQAVLADGPTEYERMLAQLKEDFPNGI